MHLNSVCVCVRQLITAVITTTHLHTYPHAHTMHTASKGTAVGVWHTAHHAACCIRPVEVPGATVECQRSEQIVHVAGDSNIVAYGRLASIPYHVGGLTGMC